MMHLRTVAVLLPWLISVRAGPPVFDEKGITKISAREGEKLEIKCSAAGDPWPTYKWYYENGEELGPISYPPVDIKEMLTLNSSYSVLIFNQIRKEYNGTYTCIAKNSHGLRSKVYEVLIYEPSNDKPVILDVEFVNITESSITILINGTGVFQGFLTKYIEKLDTAYESVFSSEMSLTLKGLKPSGEYNFTFSPTSSQEYPEVWTKNYIVVLRPDIPDVIIRSLNGGVLHVEWFHTFDDIKRNTIDQYHLTYYTIEIHEGNYFKPSSCQMKIEIPLCFGSRYTVAGLQHKSFYQVEVQAHTSTGYGQPSKSKIYVS